MMSQTITLIHFFLLNYSQKKNVTLLLVILLVGFFSAQFVNELSLINSAEAQFSFQIEFYRYGLILLSALILIVAVADDFTSLQFENLLSMPLARWQYVVAQISAMAVVNFAIVLFASSILLVQVDLSIIVFWLMSMWLELMLCSLLALLAILSLEKIPSAMIFFLSLYLLSRSSSIIVEIIAQSVYYSDGDMTNQMVLWLFQVITYVLPNQAAFLQNDLFFASQVDSIMLWGQFQWFILYGVFIVVIIMFDFYRKEFALNQH